MQTFVCTVSLSTSSSRLCSFPGKKIRLLTIQNFTKQISLFWGKRSGTVWVAFPRQRSSETEISWWWIHSFVIVEAFMVNSSLCRWWLVTIIIIIIIIIIIHKFSRAPYPLKIIMLKAPNLSVWHSTFPVRKQQAVSFLTTQYSTNVLSQCQCNAREKTSGCCSQP